MWILFTFTALNSSWGDGVTEICFFKNKKTPLSERHAHASLYFFM